MPQPRSPPLAARCVVPSPGPGPRAALRGLALAALAASSLAGRAAAQCPAGTPPCECPPDFSSGVYLPATLDNLAGPLGEPWPPYVKPPCLDEGTLAGIDEPLTIGTCDVGARGIFYTPPEVMFRHCTQQLNVFYPDRPDGTCTPPLLPPSNPSPNGLYKVILYSPASALTEVSEGEVGKESAPLQSIGAGGPQSVPPYPDFLRMMLEEGWVVVTVGSVGIDSPSFWTELDGAPPQPSDYQDKLDHGPNVFHEHGTPEWHSADVFWGEKDFVWARQFLAQHAAELKLDDDHVYVAGVSTGALYAAHCALGPERTTASITVKQRQPGLAGDLGAPVPGEPDVECFPAFGSQLRQPTRVRGFIALNLAGVWFPAYKASRSVWSHFAGDAAGNPPAPFITGPLTLGQLEDQVTEQFLDLYPEPPYDIVSAADPTPVPASLKHAPAVSPAITGSISHWVRDVDSNARDTRVLVVSSEHLGPLEDQTLARGNGGLVEPPEAFHPEAYSILDGFSAGAPFVGGVHSVWNGYTLFEDLYAVQVAGAPGGPGFHEENSRLLVDKRYRVPLFHDELGPPFHGVTEIGVDPPPHKYPYQGEMPLSDATGAHYAGHATSTYDSGDYGGSNPFQGITQRMIRQWLEPNAGAAVPLGCGYNPAGSLVVVDGDPLPGATMTIEVGNPIHVGSPGNPANPTPAQLQYVQEMTGGSAQVFALWSGNKLAPTPQSPCGVVLPQYGMQFFAGADPVTGQALLDDQGQYVWGRGELIVELPLLLAEGVGVYVGPDTGLQYQFTIPNSPSAVGVSLYLQGLVLDTVVPGTIVPGATQWRGLTEALELVIGEAP